MSVLSILPVLADHPGEVPVAIEVVTGATLSALLVKFTSFLKYVSDGKYRESLTQVVAWIAGILVVWLGSVIQVTEDVIIFGHETLGVMNGWSVILAGLAMGSGGAFAYDFKKALDGTDSASEPPLGGGRIRNRDGS